MATPAATVGVLALQGGVLEHEAAFGEVGLRTARVRRPGDLEGVDGLVLPGGESTTVSMLLETSGLFEPITGAIRRGMPVFGTCAGLILLARRVEDGRADQRSFGALDCTVRRNGYGPQRYSFEGLVRPVHDDLEPQLGAMPAVFIRAPLVTDVGPGVEVLATEGGGGWDGTDAGADGRGGRLSPVVLRQGHVLAASFHPELTSDRRLQRLFAAMVQRAPGARGAPGRADARAQ